MLNSPSSTDAQAKKRGPKEPAEAKPREKIAYAWTLLHEARQARAPEPEKETVPVGRPPKTMPTKQTTITFTAGDEEALRKWQAIFKGLLGRKPSIGETAGILARVCTERWEAIPDENKRLGTLAEFVHLFMGEEAGPDAQ